MAKKIVGIVILAALGALGLGPTAAVAFTLYFTVNDGTNPPTLLFKINTATLVTENLGPIPGTLIPGLAPSSDRDVLYAADRNNQELLRINVSTFPAPGSVQTVGSFGRDIRELAYDAGTNTLYGFDFGNERLYIVNTATGAATTDIGSIGLRLRAMTFNQVTRTLYGVASFPDGGELYRIDPNTAALTLVNTGQPGLDQISGIHVVGSTAATTMFAIGRDSASNFYTIDQATGVATALTPVSFAGGRKARDLAAPLDELPAPALGRWGLILSFLLLAGFALRRLRA